MNLKEIILYKDVICDKALEELVIKKGYKSGYDIPARFDEDIIRYFKDNYIYSKGHDTYRNKCYEEVKIESIDIDRRWTIMDGYCTVEEEYLVYLDKQENNYYKLIEKDY